MTAGPWQFTTTARTKILNGTLRSGDTYKVALFTSASNLSAASTGYASVTGEVAEANGYLTGGHAVTFELTGTTTVTVSFAANPAWFASGGQIVARYAAIYEVGGDVLTYCLLDDAPADVTVANGSALALTLPVYDLA